MTVRAGSRVRRERFDDAEPALTAMRARLSEVDTTGASSALGRHYEPGQIVAARAELRGPSRRRAGADVHGDGRIAAWTGWIRRRPLEPRDGETPWDAIAREVRGG